MDISNLGRARQFFDEITLLNYSPGYVAAQLMNNPSLSAVTRFLGQQVSDLARKKIAAIKEIQGLEAERQAAGRSAEEAKKAADAKIAESEKRVSDKLEQEKLTLADIEETKKFRAELKEAGFES